MSIGDVIYSKKADLTLNFKHAKKYIKDYCIYFKPTEEYSTLEAERIIKDKREDISKKLDETFKSRVSFVTKPVPLEEIKITKRDYGLLLTNAGAIAISEDDMIKI